MSSTPETSHGPIDVDVDEAFRDLVLDASLTSGTNPIVELLGQHLGIHPVDAAQATDTGLYRDGPYTFPIIQAGLDAYLAQPGRTHEVVGALCPVADAYGFVLTFSKLFAPASLSWPGATLGPATWEKRECGYQRTMRCLAQGLILFRDSEGPGVIWVTTSRPAANWITRHLVVVTADRKRSAAVLKEIRRLGLEHSPYRGEMFVPNIQVEAPSVFMPRPEWVSADHVILPPGLRERIDQHAVGISLGSKRLRAAGQHLKRGLLLYGPPGTGKTHSIRYLIGQLPKETSILVSPASDNAPWQLAMVRYFLPLVGPSAVVIFDDVDYMASNRTIPGVRTGLFGLLEVLDGLESHGDVLFVLTTNRLNVMEPAVAARPGRIDEALEVPLPDADCRQRLFDLYRHGMDLEIDDADMERVIERTEGVTSAFFKELLRRATVIAVASEQPIDERGAVLVTKTEVFGALDEMLDPANPVTRLLLGAQPETKTRKIVARTETTR